MAIWGRMVEPFSTRLSLSLARRGVSLWVPGRGGRGGGVGGVGRRRGPRRGRTMSQEMGRVGISHLPGRSQSAMTGAAALLATAAVRSTFFYFFSPRLLNLFPFLGKCVAGRWESLLYIAAWASQPDWLRPGPNAGPSIPSSLWQPAPLGTTDLLIIAG